MAQPAAHHLAQPLLLTRRAAAFALLLVLVVLLHGALADWVRDQAGAFELAAAPRLKAQFSVELRPADPPVVAAVTAVAPRRPGRVQAMLDRAPAADAPVARPVQPAQTVQPVQTDHPAPAPAAAASAPGPGPVPAADVAPATLADAPAASTGSGASLPAAPAEPDLVSTATTMAAAASAASTTFEWPRSTRLSYRLSGHYLGPVDGQASVEWLHQDGHYQVHLEVSVGPAIAPVMSRRLSSDGEVGPAGLVPRRYDEETRIALRAPRRVSMSFDGAAVQLANGSSVPRPAGVQDSASQFVQLTWLFTTRAQPLRVGESLEIMLALPRRVEPWVYDVLALETLQTPVGPLDTVHVRPRRLARPGGDLTAEAWFAPQLQHLPVRIVIRQDGENYVDLMLARLPQQAAAAPR